MAELEVLRAQNATLRNTCTQETAVGSSDATGILEPACNDTGSHVQMQRRAPATNQNHGDAVIYKSTFINRVSSGTAKEPTLHQEEVFKRPSTECEELKSSLTKQDSEVTSVRFEAEAHLNLAKDVTRKHHSLEMSPSHLAKTKTKAQKHFSTSSEELINIVNFLKCAVDRQKLEIKQLELCTTAAPADVTRLLRKSLDTTMLLADQEYQRRGTRNLEITLLARDEELKQLNRDMLGICAERDTLKRNNSEFMAIKSSNQYCSSEGHHGGHY